MYAVIFRAEIAHTDEEYEASAAQLRELALSAYGCTEFVSSRQGTQEVAISYWESLEQIQAWKADALHRQAQQKGREHWYSRYSVEVVEILRAYASEPGE